MRYRQGFCRGRFNEGHTGGHFRQWPALRRARFISWTARFPIASNFLGLPPEQRITTTVPSPGKHIIGIEFTKKRIGEYNESHGPLKLYVDDKVVAEAEIRTMTGHFSLCGEGLCVGYDSSDPVSSDYGTKSHFTGGTITKVVFDVADDAYVDIERHMQAAMMRD